MLAPSQDGSLQECGVSELPRAALSQDKATMDMEAMEDGYIAKILKPDGAQDVSVGEVLASYYTKDTRAWRTGRIAHREGPCTTWCMLCQCTRVSKDPPLLHTLCAALSLRNVTARRLSAPLRPLSAADRRSHRRGRG